MKAAVKQDHPLKGRKQSPEQIAKRIATIKAKRAAREVGQSIQAVVVRRRGDIMPDPEDLRDAVMTLRRLRKIAKRPDHEPEDVALLGMLALRMLEGGLK